MNLFIAPNHIILYLVYILQVVLKEEPSSCGDNTDTVTFSNQTSSFENSDHKLVSENFIF
jgi:hypothetical protein